MGGHNRYNAKRFSSIEKILKRDFRLEAPDVAGVLSDGLEGFSLVGLAPAPSVVPGLLVGCGELVLTGRLCDWLHRSGLIRLWRWAHLLLLVHL